MDDLKKILHDSKALSRKVYENKIIKDSFTYDNINFFSLLDFRIDYFFWKVLDSINDLKNYQNVKSDKISPSIFISPLNHDLINIVYKLKQNQHIFFSKISKSSSGSEKLMVFLHSLIKPLLKLRMISGKGILFVMPGAHVIGILHLFKALKKKGIPYFLICYNLDQKQFIQLSLSGINFVTKDEIRSRDIVNGASKIIRQFRFKWLTSAHLFKATNESRRYVNIINKATSLRVKAFLKFEAEEIVSDYLSALDFLERGNFKTLITSTDPDLKVAPFIVAAHKKKLKTITLQHGAYSLPDNVKYLSQKMLVWGSYWRNWYFEKLEKDKKSLTITGSGFFDRYKIQSFKKVRRKPKVLFLLVNPYLNIDRFNRDLNKAVNGILEQGASKVTLRPHPWQKVTLANLKIKNAVEIDPEGLLDDALRKADLVITMDTTAGYNAIILGKPTIYWDFLKLKRMPFEECGIPCARSSSELIDLHKAVSRNKLVFSDKKRIAHLEDVFYMLDGKSYLRIYEEISKSL